MKPIIGVVPLWDEHKDSFWMLPGYLDGIITAGGIPVMLPLTSDISMIEQCVNTFDGFLFTGGHDVSPLLYDKIKLKECGTTFYERDEMETLLLKAVLKCDKPIFGICRGIQIINVILGGTLYQDLKSQKCINHVQTPPYDKPYHMIDILPDTPLHKIALNDEIAVNSYHHQAIKVLSPELKAMALSKDGIIEAVYMPEKTFVWAVQWHPEFWLKDKVNISLFNTFLEACLHE